ncbi:MAG: hypothetical protein WBS14_22760, partial [Rhodomicrobium sp.]
SAKQGHSETGALDALAIKIVRSCHCAPSSRIYQVASSPEFLVLLLQVNRNNRFVSLRSSVTESNSLESRLEAN